MDLKTSLVKAEEMLGLITDYYRNDFSQEKRDRMIGLYAELEELIHQFEGVEVIAVDGSGSRRTIYKDMIAAGWLSHSTAYMDQGRTQLVKIISKIRSRLVDPGTPDVAASIEQLLRTLARFRECCQFIKQPPENEASVQDIIWVMLRAQFDRLDRENALPRFGAKAYRPDFGVPDLRALIEVKYIGPKTDVGSIQEEILADVPGYLTDQSKYVGIVVVVYDAAHKLRDARKFIEDLKSVEGILDVMVVPGIASPGW